MRRLLAEDGDRFRAWAVDEELRRCYLGAQLARISADVTEWIPTAFGAREPHPRRPAARCGHLVRVIETMGGQTLGWIELRDTNWRRRNGEMRICLGDRQTWGRGYGSEAIRLFLSLAFDHWRLDSIHLRVATWNTRAIRAYERCGFRREARLRAGRYARDGVEDLWLMRADRPAGCGSSAEVPGRPVEPLAAGS